MCFSLPKPVKRRIKALKKLQFKTIEIEAKFYEEVHELECKYQELYAPLFDRVSYMLIFGLGSVLTCTYYTLAFNSWRRG